MIIEDVKEEVPPKSDGLSLVKQGRGHRRQKTIDIHKTPIAEAMMPYLYNIDTLTPKSPPKRLRATLKSLI